MKCENCKDPIPKGEECYIFGKKVCNWCFNKLKRKNPRKTSMTDVYKEWLNKTQKIKKQADIK